MRDYFELFITFIKIGLTTFGGGYSMLPILQKEVVEKKGWATYEEVMDYYAISQCTPGVIAVNTAVFIGYRCKKVSGGIACALGIAFPSVVIILTIALFLQNIMGVTMVQQAFAGIRIAVAALVLSATITLFQKGIIDKYTFAIFAVCLAVIMIWNVSPIIPVIVSGIAGIIIKKIQGGNAK